jgi:hypothetical protein
VTTDPSHEKRTNWRRRLRPAAPVVLFATAVVLAVLGFARGPDGHDPAPSRPLPTRALAPERRPPSPETVDLVDRDAPPPRRIRIPAIGVSAPVIPLHLEPDGTMQTPSNFADTGWFKPGHEPGERGPAVIVGHVDSTTGPAVFYRLRDLRRGNVISVVRGDGSVVRFRIEGLERWPKSSFPSGRVFGRTRISTLRLVTCSGSFDSSTGHYVDNTIVYAAREPVRRVLQPR